MNCPYIVGGTRSSGPLFPTLDHRFCFTGHDKRAPLPIENLNGLFMRNGRPTLEAKRIRTGFTMYGDSAVDT